MVLDRALMRHVGVDRRTGGQQTRPFSQKNSARCPRRSDAGDRKYVARERSERVSKREMIAVKRYETG